MYVSACPFFFDKMYQKLRKKTGGDNITQLLWIKRGGGSMSKGRGNRILWMELIPSGFYALALMMSTNSALREAPPTRNPSTSFWEASSLQVPPVTEPGKQQWYMGKDWFQKMRHFPLFCPNHELTSIDDPDWIGHSIGHVGLQPRPQFLVNFLSLRYHTGDVFEAADLLVLLWKYLAVFNIYLLWGGGLAGADGPHRLISEHNLAPVLYIVCQRDKT